MRLAVLLGADDALEHAVDGLEVRGVRCEEDRELFTAVVHEGALGAEVVLDVARAALAAHGDGALELAEHLTVGLAGDVREDVEPAAVRHADRGAVQARLRGALQDLVEERDERLATLEAEALLTDVLRLQEGLEGLGLVELRQDAQLLVVAGLLVLELDVLLEPRPLVGVLDVHVLDAGRAAVRVAEDAEDVAQLHEALAAEAVRHELAVEIPEGQAVVLDLEVGVQALHVRRAGRCRP